MTNEQISDLNKALCILNELNIQIHQGKDIKDNDLILDAMEFLEVGFHIGRQLLR